jgi:hypothetical protein
MYIVRSFGRNESISHQLGDAYITFEDTIESYDALGVIGSCQELFSQDDGMLLAPVYNYDSPGVKYLEPYAKEEIDGLAEKILHGKTDSFADMMIGE